MSDYPDWSKPEERYAEMLRWRGVEPDDACPGCGGAGNQMYGSTATWHGGVGGQMLTPDVCDKCWGTGSKTRTGVNLRRLMRTPRVAGGGMKYRKKPITVEAVFFAGQNFEAIREFAGSDVLAWSTELETATIRTIDGEYIVPAGWWIIRGVGGEHYPCRSDIFDATYEAVP